MGKQLGQGDIDALFAAAGANASAPSAGLASEALLERYDFSRAGQISNDQMRANFRVQLVARARGHFLLHFHPRFAARPLVLRTSNGPHQRSDQRQVCTRLHSRDGLERE